MRTLRLISTTLLIVVLCLNFTSCSDDNESKKNVIILADDTQRELTFSAKEETKEIKFTSSESWSAYIYYSSENDWITVTPTEGGAGENTISIKVNSNSQYSYRGVTLGIRIPKQETQIYITQEGKEDILYTQNIEVAGTLYELLGTYDMHKLKLTGYLNGTDVATIRKMPLTEIDLSDVNIVGGGTYTVHYIGLGTGEYRGSTSDNVFPSYFFYDKTTIQSVVLPNTITMIDARAFAYCENLSSIVIPNGVTEIGMEAFRECKGLTSITIPNSVTKIGYEAFQACTLLKSEFFPYEDAYIDRAALPNALQTLGAGVFTDCKNMESINMQRTQVKNILRNTYSGCSGITTFYYPNVVETIGEFAFSGCSALVGSFFPASLTSIETNAFHLCTKMSQVYCLGSTPPTLGTAAFDSSLKSISTLFVPEAAISAYSSSSWNPYFKEIKKDLLHP